MRDHYQASPFAAKKQNKKQNENEKCNRKKGIRQIEGGKDVEKEKSG